MRASTRQSFENVKKQFVYLASELSNRFPELDLRFNLQSGSNQLRYRVCAISRDVYELPLGKGSPQELLHQAIFTIKQRARLFDS